MQPFITSTGFARYFVLFDNMSHLTYCHLQCIPSDKALDVEYGEE